MTFVERPSDAEILAALPELASFGREAVLLDPARGHPGVRDSSIGGPLLWPADEPWPVCSGPDEEEPSGVPAVAMVPVAQIYARDVPGPWWPAGTDLLQVLWCPNEHWDAPANQADVSPIVELRWRQVADVDEHLVGPPHPVRHYEFGYLPEPCMFTTKRLIDFPYREELPVDLQPRLQRLIEETDDEGKDTITRLPGWKLGGWPTWHLSQPTPITCEACGVVMPLVFTIASDDQSAVVVGRWGELRIFACQTDHCHPFHVNLH
ncbi:hypothetical protein [Streptomyces sp. NPDC021224]|uniref:hypothetical protein n=1 Tax=unclassified Streptomyces TaxID=2593676 RepID=UPI0037AC6433